MNKNTSIKLLTLILCVMIIVTCFTSVVFAETNQETNAGVYMGFSNGGDICSDINSQEELISNTAITILMHGQNGSAKSWSNQNNIFTFDENSLIENLRYKFANSDVYIGKTYFDKEKNLLTYKLFQADYKNVNPYVNYANELSIKKLVQTNKHSIIVFESSEMRKGDHHDNAYQELHKFIDNIVYDYKYTTGIIPKVNLIGHSRGGILNMMYANSHPQLINSIFSLGTPYKGTNMGTLVSALMNRDIIGGVDSVTCGSGQDIHNTILQETLKTNWEAAYEVNPNINAYALAGTTSANLLKVCGEIMATDPQKSQYANIITTITDIICTFPQLSLNLLDTAGLMYAIFGSFVDMVQGQYPDLEIAILNVLNSMHISETDMSLSGLGIEIDDDIMVNKTSQHADGFIGFTRFSKTYDAEYAYFDRCSTGNIPIPHNLESRDPEMIDYIIDRIDLQNSSSLFLTRQLSNSSVEIVGVRDDMSVPAVLIVPNSIGDKTVTAITRKAFSDTLKFNCVQKLILPSSVDTIESGSMKGLNVQEIEVISNANFKVLNNALVTAEETRLILYAKNSLQKSYVLPNNMKEIENDAFRNAQNLESVTLPKMLRYIGNYAFKDSAISNFIFEGNSVDYIGVDAFADTPFIKNNTSEYLTLGNVLLKYGGTATQLNELPSNINAIGSYAFTDSCIQRLAFSENIKKIMPYGIAFVSNLETVTLTSNLNYIGAGALQSNINLQTVNLKFDSPELVDKSLLYFCDTNFVINVRQLAFNEFKNSDEFESFADNIQTINTTIMVRGTVVLTTNN